LYSGAGGGTIGALETNGGVTISGNSGKTVDYLAVGKLATAGCYNNSAATVNTLVGPFAPKPWPLAPPAVPTLPSGCTSLATTQTQWTITKRARSGGVATLTVSSMAIPLQVGDHVTVAGVTVPGGQTPFNGFFAVTAVDTVNKTFSYNNPGNTVNSTNSSGTVTRESATITAGWNTTHSPGIYCVTGSTATLVISGATLTGGAGYTFFAPFIDVSGGSYKNFSPSGTLFYASGASGFHDLIIHGSGATITGYIFAPNGQVALEGGGVSAGNGYIESQTLSILGNSANFTGTGPGGPGTTSTTTSTIITTTTTPGFTDPGTTVITTTPGTTSTIGTTLALKE